MSKKSVPGGEYELNSQRAHVAAYVLIAGLVLELVNAVIWYRGTETLAEIAAVLLIVGGVWGEVFFANKARLAGDKELAELRARAAEADQKAQEAALTLARFRRPRVKLQSQAQPIPISMPFAQSLCERLKALAVGNLAKKNGLVSEVSSHGVAIPVRPAHVWIGCNTRSSGR